MHTTFFRLAVMHTTFFRLAVSSPAVAVRVDQFGECQCPLTSSWFSAFYEGCLEGR